MKDDDIKDISFKESFRRARQAGLKDFPFDGKRYSTELASSKPTTKAEVPAAAKPAAPAAPSPQSAESKPSSMSEGADPRDRPSGNPYVEGVKKYGPGAALAAASLIPAGRLIGTVFKGVQSARASNAAAKLAKGNANLADRMKGITGAAEKEAAKNATKRDMFNASQERMKAGAGKAAEERLTGLANNPRRANIPVRENPRAATKFNSDEAGVEFRKGGKAKAYAKGGSVSSASKRADGCATKGKTNCKVY
jgi:hypothetical protein